MFEPEEKKGMIDLYEGRLEKYGVNVKTMGWRDKAQQDLRFAVLAGIGNLNNTTLLDVGCGFGDLYSYLVERGIMVDYTGYDIAPKIIGAARDRHSELRLEVNDILKERSDEKFDYVVESGILNKRISNNIGYARDMITRMFERCRIGIGVNMMTDYVDYKEDYLYYYSPEEIFTFCKSLTRWVSLRNDYPLYEFSIFLYRGK